MTLRDEAVILIGPNVIRGPGAVDDESASVALKCIDDRSALVGDRVVPIERLWQEVLRAAVDGSAIAALVLPSWWTRQRISLVVDALPAACAEVVVMRRADVLRHEESCVVVEIADDLVAVHADQDAPAAIPRTDAVPDVGAAVVEQISSWAVVVIDAPSMVIGARTLAEGVARMLRARGTRVSLADDDLVLRTIRAATKPGRRLPLGRLAQPRVAAVSASVLLVVALAGAAVGSGADDPRDEESTWVVEGRVTVEVPAQWQVERVTSGPGSARLQVVSTSDRRSAIHVVQSSVPRQQSLASAAEVLRTALAAQQEGVFVEFKSDDRRADRPVITYREVRLDHLVDWTVVLDAGVRIAIGCQRAPDGSWPERICERAIRSARVVA